MGKNNNVVILICLLLDLMFSSSFHRTHFSFHGGLENRFASMSGRLFLEQQNFYIFQHRSLFIPNRNNKLNWKCDGGFIDVRRKLISHLNESNKKRESVSINFPHAKNMNKNDDLFINKTAENERRR